MTNINTFKKVFVGAGVLIALGIVASSVGIKYIAQKDTSGNVSITVSAQTQKQIEASLVGGKKEGYFPVAEGKFVFAKRP